MSPTKPLISVIVPVYNGDKYLAHALESILIQDYKPVEIIVVDDGSTDLSAQVVKSLPMHYSYQKHSGLGAALNHGIKMATGDSFAFLDADDLWARTKLSRQLACF